MPTTITMNGIASGRPSCGSQWMTPISFVTSDWSIPRIRPAAAAIAKDWKRATSATASAGTMKSV